MLRSSQRVTENFLPHSQALFASRVWTDCTGRDRRAQSALADLFFFGWLLEQRPSFRSVAALELLSRALLNTGHDPGRLAARLAQEVRLEVGSDEFRNAYTIVSAFASRHIELSSGIEQALTFSFEALIRLGSLCDGLPFQIVRLMTFLPEERIFELAEPYWPNWSTNWRLAFENKRLDNPIWALAQHAMIADDVYYFLFLSLIDPDMSFQEAKRSIDGINHDIWWVADLHMQNTQSEIKRVKLMVGIDYDNYVHRRKWSKDYWFLERLFAGGKEGFRRLQKAEEHLKDLAKNDYVGKLDQMAGIEDFMRLIEARELAKEIEAHVKAETKNFDLARNSG